MYLNNCKTFIFFDLGTISFCLSILLVFTNSNRGIFLSGGFFPIFFTILFWGISSCKKKLPKINATAFLILFLLCVTLAGLTCIFKRNVFELGQFSTFILWGSLFLLFIIHVKKYQQFYFILHSCTASGLLLSIFTIFSKEKYDLDVTRGSFRFMEQNMMDPNFLATFICLGIYATCFLFIYHKKHRIFNGFAISTMMAAVFITGSRAGFLYLCIAFVGIYFELLDLFRHDIKKKLILIISTVSFSFIIILSLYKLKPDLFQRFFLNINAYVGDGSNQKRLHHWMVALQRISDAPFWGYGTTSEKLVMSDVISDTSHNTFLSFYIRLGLLGLISFCLIVAYIFFQALKKHQYFLIFIIIGFVINIFIIPATMSYVTWISLMVFYMLNQYMDYIKTTSNMRKKNFTIINTGFLAWAADPFVYNYKGNTYLFAEYWEYKRNKGSIAVCKLDESHKKWTVIIREPHHLSYPQIFTIGENIYMCPEAYESNSIYLYKATVFPDQWEKQSPLIENIHAVDTTFFSYEQEIYCFTYDLDHNSLLFLKLNPKSMKLSFSSNNPINTDIGSARMAGNILHRNQKYLRVSQDCNNIYGKALVFHQFQIKWPHYQEKFIKKITTDNIPVNSRKKYYGIHTYNETSHYEVVDLKYNHFNLLELYYRIKRKILKLI